MSGARTSSPTAAVPKSSPAKDPLFELTSLIGLDDVKEEVKRLRNLLKVRKLRLESGLRFADMSFHMVFTGNPGTGKTTVARILAQIFRQFGLVSKGHLVETDRSGLVAGYVGQTALKTSAAINSAIGGVLFIDEAYALKGDSASDYGNEAIDTLVKGMEDNRNNLVVIVAGYPDKMNAFINSNPGFQSRFNKYMHFSDYLEDELVIIFDKLCQDNGYNLDAEAKLPLRTILRHRIESCSNFGNARDVRNLFEYTVENQANRVAESVSSSTDLTIIKPIDVLAPPHWT
jgi:SpoVK/Ycf46/Vps4 family AAA+-type ATPase